MITHKTISAKINKNTLKRVDEELEGTPFTRNELINQLLFNWLNAKERKTCAHETTTSNPHGWFLQPRVDIMRMAARDMEEMCGGSLETGSDKDT